MGKWLLGILLLVIGAAAYALIMGPKISENMGDDIRAALQNQNYDWAGVEMNGHIATVTGNAPSNDAARGAVETAQNTVCSDCQTDSPWHRVLSDVTVTTSQQVQAVEPPAATVESPYTFSVTKLEDGNVTLDGYVGNAQERDSVLAKANTAFSESVQSASVEIASGAPDENWVSVIEQGIEELALMDSGRFQLENNNFLIHGQASSAEIRERINNFASDVPAAYNGASNINVPNLASDVIGQVESQAICQTLFDDLNEGTKIEFPSGQSDITGDSSFDLLAEISAAANQCQNFRIQIDGYTDNTGDTEANQQLSERRANRVLAYLTQQGVERNRMTATGHGESNPIGDNATAQGQEMNRRTTFTLTQAQ
ncbi:OmpA family protein [Litorimonas haliclonae]|uniref:OmpA family protein n=1 Tax=Litorimonas haliclonae TaxID=2081977 RepID=UPI0039EE238E